MLPLLLLLLRLRLLPLRLLLRLLTRRRPSTLLLLPWTRWGSLAAPTPSPLLLLMLLLPRTLLLLLLLRPTLRIRRPMAPGRRWRSTTDARRLLRRRPLHRFRVKPSPLRLFPLVMALPRQFMVPQLRLPQGRLLCVLDATPLTFTFG